VGNKIENRWLQSSEIKLIREKLVHLDVDDKIKVLILEYLIKDRKFYQTFLKDPKKAAEWVMEANPQPAP